MIRDLLLTSAFCHCLIWSNWTTSLVSTSKGLFLKAFVVSISMPSNQRDGSTIKFFLQINDQTSLHHWLYWDMKWIHEVFQDIWRWPVMKQVILILSHSYLILLGIVVDYWKLRSFQETQVNLNGLLEKPDIMYQSQNSFYVISRAKLRNYSKDIGPCWKYSISVGTTIFPKTHWR